MIHNNQEQTKKKQTSYSDNETWSMETHMPIEFFFKVQWQTSNNSQTDIQTSSWWQQIQMETWIGKAKPYCRKIL